MPREIRKMVMEDNPVATLMMRLVKMMDKNPYIKKAPTNRK
jgi:hypothetical protein